MPRHSKDTVAILGIDIGKDTFLYVSHCGSRKVAARWHAEWSVAKTTRAIAGDGPNAGPFPSRADSPGATKHFACAKSDWKAPEVDTCPGGTAATNAQWGDAPSSASTGTGWGCGGNSKQLNRPGANSKPGSPTSLPA